MTNSFQLNEQVEVKFLGRIKEIKESQGGEVTYTVITNKGIAVVGESCLTKQEEKRVVSK